VVVDTDETASRVLEMMKRDKAGRVTFVPLNRVQPQTHTYPAENDVIPLLSKLDYNPAVRPAMEQIFARTIVCPSLEICEGYARSHKLDAITLDGDKVERKGAMIGGYRDPKRSRLATIKSLAACMQELRDTEVKLAKVKAELGELEGTVTILNNEVTQLARKKRTLHESREPLLAEIAQKEADIGADRNAITDLESVVERLGRAVTIINSEMSELRSQIGTPLKAKLSVQEEGQLQEAIKEIQLLRPTLNEISRKRSDVIREGMYLSMQY